MSRAQQDALSRTALGIFQLNGQFLAVSDKLATPLTVSGIARAMGITRQSAQRIADLLVRKGLAEYVPNPAHRRAKLLRPTEEGRAAMSRIGPGHAEFAARLAEKLGEAEFAETVRVLERLSAAVEAVEVAGTSSPSEA
ncbi:MarR family transcriptional regulator [Streptomyces sp. NBC_00846]|uniref:MarR family winged helix-turn-helix transcriptional regulator n=1 Tax=Streptomyces sp. NBC_00846 TaxID=2975849 RepID=UPI00386A72DA|nr:MarR family transcriptional regulator [Streptomyces sp. NBC_00846]